MNPEGNLIPGKESMPETPQPKAWASILQQRNLWLAAVWTVVLAASLSWNLLQIPRENLEVARLHPLWLTHLLMWLLGLAGIGWQSRRLQRSLEARGTTEKTLQETDQTLQTLIQASPLGVMSLDNAGLVKIWNPAARAIFGWSISEAMGHPPLIIPEDKQEKFADILSRGRQGESMRGLTVCRRKDGASLDICYFTAPLSNPQGENTGLIVILEDITERIQAETALHQANEELKIWIFEYGQRNRDITLLNQMSDMLQACRSVDEAYSGLARFGKLLFPQESGAVFIHDTDKNLFEAMATWGKSLNSSLRFQPDDCWALRKNQEHLFSEPQRDQLCAHLSLETTTKNICVPLAAHGETMGLLLVQGKPVKEDDLADEDLSESKQRLAVTAAKQMALALANLNLRHSLFLQAIHDPLTGLYNRRYMEETLEREIYRVQRKGSSLGIVMLDLDHFKRFNDTYGHEAGDTLLREVSQYLRNHIRQGDIACRYGGEEFLLILPEAALEITRERAENLRLGVQLLQVKYQGQSLGTVTVSLGVAIYPDHGTKGDEVIRAADAALYRAKQEGRNRVVAAAHPESQPHVKKLTLVDAKKH